jgi:transposase
MELIYKRCCGLDVHKRIITACIRLLLENGSLHQETKTFGTMTRDLLELADWLAAAGVTHVVLESTGSYWKPVYNILEGRFKLVLVNARHFKHVPGRKTDVQDCQWLAQLLQAGLLKGSFIPERPQRELRDLTRHRSQLVAEKNRAANRIQKILEDANIKLASVASDILGASGRDMLRALIRGETDAEKMAHLARRQLRSKIPQLRPALEGKVTEHHRFMLDELLSHLKYLEGRIEEFSRRIEEVSRPFAPAIAKVATLPGFDQRSAKTWWRRSAPTWTFSLRRNIWRRGWGSAPATTKAPANARAARPLKVIAGCVRPCLNPPGPLPAKKTLISRPNTAVWPAVGERSGLSWLWPIRC